MGLLSWLGCTLKIAVNYPILKFGGDDYWFWITVEGVWRDPNMFQTSLNQYFFDPELSNFPAPLFALIVPIIVFRKKRVWNLMLMEVMYSLMFLNLGINIL